MIKIDAVTKKYGTITALEHIDLSIGKGEIFGLLGPNGAGKTTLIKILTALSRPDSGTCAIDGIDVAAEPDRIKPYIGVAPQENNLDRELTAYENLLIYAMLHRCTDRETRIAETLKRVDLWDRKDSIVAGFSGGMQRRLLLARSLLTEPAILFLDEPSLGLDPQIRRQLWDIIRKTRIDGRTVVITTHYIEEAEALCNRVGILAKGRLIALDAPDNLKMNVGRFVVERINEDGKLIQRICPTRDAAHDMARGENNGVTVRKTNLEDVFIQLTGERLE
ncbi:MAG: ABC transporter ATP-binding protein [Deltaproteobacteria bacterium]|nr:ABC transporter ATP-binding protein [Deltaproteobacteria bacterium]